MTSAPTCVHMHTHIHPHAHTCICTHKHMHTTQRKLSGKLDSGLGDKDDSTLPLLTGSASGHTGAWEDVWILWQRITSTPSQGRAGFGCKPGLLVHKRILHLATVDEAFFSSSPLGHTRADTMPSPAFPWCGCKSCHAFSGYIFWTGKKEHECGVPRRKERFQ